MTRSARDPLYRRHWFPVEVIAHAVWLYFRFPLSLRMVKDMLAARGIIVSHQIVRLWAQKFGRHFAIISASVQPAGSVTNGTTRSPSLSGERNTACGGPSINTGFVLDVLVQSRWRCLHSDDRAHTDTGILCDSQPASKGI